MESLTSYLLQPEEHTLDTSMILAHQKFQEALKATFKKIKHLVIIHWRVHSPILVHIIQQQAKALCPPPSQKT